MSHTPGPWKVDRPYIRGAGRVIASLESGRDKAEDAANARLIAAAPELYQVCWELEKLNPNSYAAEKARKIIAKLQREEGKKSE